MVSAGRTAGVLLSAAVIRRVVRGSWAPNSNVIPMTRRIQPLTVLLVLVDMMLVPVGLWISIQLRSTIPLGRGGALSPGATEIPIQVYGLAMLCWGVGLISSGAYDPQLSRRWYGEVSRVLWGSLLATALMAGVLYFTFRELSRLQFGYYYAVTVALALSYRGVFRVYYRAIGKSRPGGRSRVLILGAGELGEHLATTMVGHSRWGFEAVGFLDDDPSMLSQRILSLPVRGSLDDLRKVVEAKSVDEVWIALPARAHERLEQVVADAERLPVRIKVVPNYFSLALVRAKTEILDGIPLIGLRDPLIEGVPRFIKRGFDLVIASLLLLPGLPVMGLIALLIRIDSSGPALLRQERVGENGRIFRMLKFRSMETDPAPNQMAAAQPSAGDSESHKRRDDPRVTKVGHVLRRFSLDELPQLFNVLKGDMSLVGPRPEIPWLVDRYESWQRKRFAVPQGITGWWQINGRSDKPMHLNTEDDLYYVYNYSLWLDLAILVRTPLAVVRGKGAF